MGTKAQGLECLTYDRKSRVLSKVLITQHVFSFLEVFPNEVVGL